MSHSMCKISDCQGVVNARRLCHKHYKRFQMHGDPLLTLQSDLKGKRCSKCDLPARKRFLCNSHYTAQWRIENPDKAQAINRANWVRRRRLVWGAEGSHTKEEWLELLDKHRGICVYCHKAPADSQDHIIPLSRGGTDYIENIAPSCLTCNKRKQAKILEHAYTNPDC